MLYPAELRDHEARQTIFEDYAQWRFVRQTVVNLATPWLTIRLTGRPAQ